MNFVIVIGSSDTVIPWSIYVGLATPAEVLNVNPEEHEKDDYFTYNLREPITEALDVIEEYVLKRMEYEDFTGVEY